MCMREFGMCSIFVSFNPKINYKFYFILFYSTFKVFS